MELVPAFVAILLAEIGGKVQGIAYAASLKPGSKAGVLAALTLSSLVYYAIAIVAGSIVGGMITPNPELLLLALALVFAGGPMLFPAKAIPVAKGGFAGSLNLFVTKQFGDASSFILFAMAARSPLPGLVGAGGLSAILVSAAIPVLLERDWPEGMMRVMGRRAAAIPLMLAGVWMAVVALRVV